MNAPKLEEAKTTEEFSEVDPVILVDMDPSKDQIHLRKHLDVNKLWRKVTKFKGKCIQLEVENRALVHSNDHLRRSSV